MGHIEEKRTGIKKYLFEKFQLVLMSDGEPIGYVGENHTTHDFTIPWHTQ